MNAYSCLCIFILYVCIRWYTYLHLYFVYMWTFIFMFSMCKHMSVRVFPSKSMRIHIYAYFYAYTNMFLLMCVVYSLCLYRRVYLRTCVCKQESVWVKGFRWRWSGQLNQNDMRDINPQMPSFFLCLPPLKG